MKLKKFLALFLSILIVLSFSGCFEEEQTEEVDNVSNGVDFFNSFAQADEFESYSFTAEVKWQIPTSDRIDNLVSNMMGADGEADGFSSTTTTEQNQKVTAWFSKKCIISGDVVKSGDKSNFNVSISIGDRSFDVIYVNDTLYINAQALLELISEGNMDFTLKNKYIAINKEAIESISSDIQEAMASLATDTDALPGGSVPMDSTDITSDVTVDITGDFNSSFTDDDMFGSDTSDSSFTLDSFGSADSVDEYVNEDIQVDGFASGELKLPEISKESITALVTPLVNGIRDVFKSAEFDVFSVDNEGSNVLTITQKDVLYVARAVLNRYKENSTELYNALQQLIKDAELDSILTITQEDIDDELADVLITVQDMIDFDETEGINFKLEIKSLANKEKIKRSIVFDLQKDADKFLFSIYSEKEKKDSANISAPGDVGTIADMLTSVFKNFDFGALNGEISPEDGEEGKEEEGSSVTIW
ncbi:MAG: hypothetical protein ACI4II_00970 [Acutalibacteraceae bacterium]